jgi:hypothetical protein
MNPKCIECIPESPADLKKRSDCANCNKPEIEAKEKKDSRDLESNATQIWEKKKIIDKDFSYHDVMSTEQAEAFRKKVLNTKLP